jgi:hypothetical protein
MTKILFSSILLLSSAVSAGIWMHWDNDRNNNYLFPWKTMTHMALKESL